MTRDDLPLPLLLWLYAQWLLETHGWKLLGGMLLLHLARKQYRALAARRHHERVLADANDPARVAVLQRETARVRQQQQQQALQSSKRAKQSKTQ